MTLKKDSILVEFSFSKGFEWIKKAKSPDKIIKHVCPPLYCRKLLIWAVKNHIYVSGQVFTKKERFFFLKFWALNPWNHRKKSSAKAREPIYRLYFGRSLQKAQGS